MIGNNEGNYIYAIFNNKDLIKGQNIWKKHI